MKLLLDTHAALWFWSGDPKCSRLWIELIENPDNDIVFHQASTLEIQLKFQQGNLCLPKPPREFIPESVRRSFFLYETISDEAIFFLGKLPNLHRDPFDRLLIAHAILNGCTILTADDKILKYPVPTISE